MRRGRSMHSQRGMPLSLRVASIYAMLVAATLLVAAGLALQFTRNQLSGQVDNQITILTNSFKNKVPEAVKNDVAAGSTPPTAPGADTKVWLSNASCFEGEGAVVSIPSLPGQNAFQPSGAYDLGHDLGGTLYALLSVPRAKWLNLRGRTGSALRGLRIPITAPNGQVAGILVVGATQSKVVNHAVWHRLKGIGAASAIGLVFATTLGLFAVRRTLRPLENMSHEVESIQETDALSKRLSGRGPRDEVGRLAEGFDRMLGRLQEAFMSQRRVLSHASPEPRTPMTLARGQLELPAMDVESLTGRRSMSIAIEELDRMGRVAEDRAPAA